MAATDWFEDDFDTLENRMAIRKKAAVKSRPVHFARTHQFLMDRNITEAYVVCRIDDYAYDTNVRGGFTPQESYGAKGGYLWPTHDLALGAAKAMVEKFPHNKYGVFKLFTIVEREIVEPPVKVTKV